MSFPLRASLLLSAVSVLPLSRADVSVSVSIDPAARTPISPHIYGSNQDIPGVTLTARRQGGNRMTGYNWENNASNAGLDYFHQSDNYLTWIMGISDADAATPGIVVTRFHEDGLAKGAGYSLVTLPVAGYVSKDKSGPVSAGETAPSARWAAVRHAKGTTLSETPDVTDGFVYTDELLNFLLRRFGRADTPRGIKGYSLDNEPSLWPHTHPRLHPNVTTTREIVASSIEAARTVKRMDSSAEVFGPALYGANAFISFQDAPDWPAEKARGSYTWFIDYYLAEMKRAGDAAGQRLLDVLDVHLYSEQRGGGERVSDSTNYANAATNQARMQAPRSLWDPTFVEDSWIGQYYPWTLPFVPKMKASIATHYPGTKLAFTEFNFGGESHVSGGIAHADALGAFGAQGVYLATWWQLHDDVRYIAAAFNLYLNYDGKGARFGNTALAATTSSTKTCSVYAAVDANDSTKLHVILLNKEASEAANVQISLGGGPSYSRARAFGFDATSAIVTERTGISSISGNQVTYRVPATTAIHLVFESGNAPPPPPPPPPDASRPTRLVNLSTRGYVGTGDQALIGGFIIGGEGSKKLLIRGIGPGLAAYNVPGVLANPQITLTRLSGEVLESNDDWSLAPNAAAIDAANDAIHWRLPAGSKDAALLVTLPAGAYTFIVRGASEGTGVVLAEMYDLEPESTTRLVNLSSRGQVRPGADVMIVGFVVGGSGSGRFLLRGLGPTLDPHIAAPHLADPRIQLTLIDGTQLDANNDWSNRADAADTAAVMAKTGGLVLVQGAKDAAFVTTRPAGGYTAIVSGEGQQTGIALVEIHEEP